MNWKGFASDIQLIVIVFIIHPWIHVEEFSWLWLMGLITGTVFVLLILYLKHNVKSGLNEVEDE